jgi:protocatechuate 3,4-dioxygenase alpha subunit
VPKSREWAPTPSQTVGPFFGFALPFEADADAITPGSQGAMRIEGQLIDGAGEPVPDGLLEVWGADQFARCRTDSEGAYHATVRKPAPGPRVEGRVQAPHLNVTVFARGLLRHLATRMYFPDEAAANRADPILERVEPELRHTLIARADGSVLHFDIRLQGEGETVFFEL